MAKIVRAFGQLYYVNAQIFHARVKAMIDELGVSLRAVILGGSAQDQIDVTGSDVLQSLVKELRGKGTDVYAAEV